MTYEEAKKEIEIDCKTLLEEGCCDQDECEGCVFHKALEALDLAIAKKPIPFFDGYADGFPAWEYECPSCGRIVDDTDLHCECGQRLNWEEEVEG